MTNAQIDAARTAFARDGGVRAKQLFAALDEARAIYLASASGEGDRTAGARRPRRAGDLGADAGLSHWRQHVTLCLTRTGSVLTGVMKGEDGASPLRDGKAQGDALSWKASVKKPVPLTQ